MSIEIFYDGDCVFCKSYIRLKHLRAAAGDVELISIRGGDPRVAQLAQEGYNLNTGMLVRHAGKIHYGAGAIHVLGRLEKLGAGESGSGFGLLLWRVFYPVLVFGRMLTLFICGKSLYSPTLYAECGPCPAPISYRVFRIALMLAAGLFLLGLTLFTFGLYAEAAVGALNAWLGHPLFIAGKEISVARVVKYTHTRMALEPAQAIAALLYLGVIIGFFFREKWPRRLFDGLARGRVKYWVFYIVIGLVVVNIYHAIPLRRAMFCILSLPVTALGFGLAQHVYRDARGGFLPALLLMIGAANLSVPGFYLPPFSDGIAGWTSNAHVMPQYTFKGYKLERDDGKEIWYMDGLFSPITMIGRFELAFRSKGTQEQFEDFMIAHYKRLWTQILSKNLLPYQSFWGKYGYPPHTVYDQSIVYGDFPPERIRRLIFVEITVQSDGKVLERKVLRSRDFN